MRRLKILENRPLIVGTIVGPNSIDSQIKTAHKAKPDLVEVRLDTMPVSLFPKIRAQVRLPLLLTIRSPQEGGQNKLSEKARLKLFRQYLPWCDLVDLELRHPNLIKALTPVARRLKVGVIHSLHDFKGIGTEGRLRQAFKTSRRLRGDILKVAVRPKNDPELETFLRWGNELNHPCPVFIGMGAAGIFSRFAAFSFGSRFAYGHLGRPAALGQPSVANLIKTTELIYGPARN